MSPNFFPFRLWSKVGLRARLVILAGLSLFGVTLVYQGIASYRSANEFGQDMTREADVVVDALNLGVAQFAAARDIEGIRVLLAESTKSPFIRHVSWVAESGHDRVDQEGMKLQGEVPRWIKSWINLPEINQARHVSLAGHHFGTIQVSFNPSYLEQRLWRQIKGQLWMTGLLVVVLMVVITLVLHRNMAMLERLPVLAKRFLAGEYKVREAQNPRLSPEVRALLSGLNAVAENIETTLRTLGRERKVLAEQLHFQQSLLDAIPLPVYYKDRNGLYLGANRAWERFFERSEGSMIGKPVDDLYPQRPDIGRFHAAKDEELLHGADIQTYEIAIPNSEGVPCNKVYTKAIYHHADGSIGGIIGVIDDVSTLRHAEAVNQRFGRILDQSLNEIYVFDAKTLKFTQVNLGARRNLGYSQAELLCMTPVDIKPEFDRQKFETMLTPLRQGRMEKLRFETVHRRRDGTDYQVQISLQLSKGESPAVFLAVVEDITDKKQAEQALRESEERFRSMTGNVPGMVFQASSQRGRLVFRYVSDGALALCARSPRLLLENARNFVDLIHSEDLAEFMNSMADSMHDLSNWQWEGRIHADEASSDEVKWINWRASPRLHDGMILWDGVAFNITEAKTAQQALSLSREQLQALSDHLQTVREEEKSHIAREIHDELGGTLTALKMDTYWVSKKLPPDLEALQQKLSGMLVLVDGAVQTTRRICTELRPTVLDDLGLIAAIEWQVAEFQRRMSIPCVFHRSIQEVELGKDVSIALFRILQESLTNVARHAEASSVCVVCQTTGQHVFLAIEDNGRGMDPAVMDAGQSHGLRGIRERARQFGGEVDIMGTPGKGTLVMVQFPVASTDALQIREQQT